MGCTNSSYSSCYLNVDNLVNPRTKPKALQKGLFWSVGPSPHWHADCNQTEVRALCSQPVNLKYIWLCWQGHCQSSSLFNVDALIHPTREVKSDQWSQDLQKAHSEVQMTRLFFPLNLHLLRDFVESFKKRISASCESIWCPYRIWPRIKYIFCILLWSLSHKCTLWEKQAHRQSTLWSLAVTEYHKKGQAEIPRD